MAEMYLTTGEVVLIDDKDRDLVSPYRWHLNSLNGGLNRYAYASINRRTTMLHRLIMDAPKGIDVDHINGDGLDNRRANLRLVTRRQNLQNQRKHQVGSSAYRGVHRRKNRWGAQIWVNYQRYWIGSFVTETEAAQAYDAKARELFGDFARLNFPEPHEQAA